MGPSCWDTPIQMSLDQNHAFGDRFGMCTWISYIFIYIYICMYIHYVYLDISVKHVNHTCPCQRLQRALWLQPCWKRDALSLAGEVWHVKSGHRIGEMECSGLYTYIYIHIYIYICICIYRYQYIDVYIQNQDFLGAFWSYNSNTTSSPSGFVHLKLEGVQQRNPLSTLHHKTSHQAKLHQFHFDKSLWIV